MLIMLFMLGYILLIMLSNRFTPSASVLSIVFRQFVSDKMKQCAGSPAMVRLGSA